MKAEDIPDVVAEVLRQEEEIKTKENADVNGTLKDIEEWFNRNCSPNEQQGWPKGTMYIYGKRSQVVEFIYYDDEKRGIRAPAVVFSGRNVYSIADVEKIKKVLLLNR